MLGNPIYKGDFIWDGKTYQGIHEPIVSQELWEKVHSVLEGRKVNRNRKSK
jgi:hypothetical protein